ncbi:MAG: phosphodiesterase [Erysipelotrichaceae bacterium]|nr:phosphodiesterase [Erysipelotrichaceae bacterium]
MKWLIASDIHGSALYCEKLIEAWKREKADRLLLLGDLLYHGPRNDLPEAYEPKKVIELLNGLKDCAFSVRGNCEAEVDQMVLQFPIMAEYLLLPVGEKLIFATHGHIYHRDHHPFLRPNDILLFGHIHVPVCEKRNGLIFMNPGSLSMPKQDTPHGYMTFEKDLFEWKKLDGEVYMNYHWKEEED